MKFNLFLLVILCSLSSYSQCFDCAQGIGGHVEDYVVDIDKVSDGIILTYNPDQGWGRTISKYDFNCNLIWTNTFLPENYGTADYTVFYDTTVDDNGNIYSLLVHGRNRNGVTIDGFPLEAGVNLVKLDSNGAIQWIRKITDGSGDRKVLFRNDNIYVVGQLDQGISNNMGLSIPEGSGFEYYVAKFDLNGNLIDSQHYGGRYDQIFYDSQIDEAGNIYITGVTNHSSTSTPYLIKVDPDLNLVWEKDLSNYLNYSFTPWDLYYNNTNHKLYIWGKYYNPDGTNNGCNVGSAVMEVSGNSGELQNHILVENCGFDQAVGNGTGDVEQRGFITHDGNNLYVLSSFRGELSIGDQTINTTQTIYDEYDSDLVLYKIDLSNFSAELVLRSEGDTVSPVNYDLAGPILAVNNTVYITSNYTSNVITINDNAVQNNSGNNDRDILFYKHLLSQMDSNNLISFSNTCYNEPTEFLINGDFDAVSWNFDDPTSGAENTSVVNNPNHTFTAAGTYAVSATVTCGTETEILDLEVVINDRPRVSQISNLHSCEDSLGSQTSSSFNTAGIENDLRGNQADLFIEYFDESGNELPSPLPNPMSNSVPGRETITARISYLDNPFCFTEVSFDLIVDPLPEIFQVDDIYACDDDADGITNFDISQVKSDLLGGQTGMRVDLFYENGEALPNPLPNTISNRIPSQETLTARITDPATNCFNETGFDLVVSPLPVAHSMNTLYGCDDNNDGISEYFDTSKIESQVLNGQTGMKVQYFDENGNELPGPLSNPFTNTSAYNQEISVRVTNQASNCYAETSLKLQTVTKPIINAPANLYACDQGYGYASFDTSSLAEEIIGNQAGLTISYFDSNNNPLPSPFPQSFRNTEAYSQTIQVKVEDASNPVCYSETSFDLVVNSFPEINLKEEYSICNLDPSISLNVSSGFNSYEWLFEDGTLISSTNNAEITEEGNYILSLTQSTNGIICEKSFAFSLARSVLPEIEQVNYGELGDNFIEIIASGEGDFEFSIDGKNYQENNYFSNIQGGNYTVYVRDKEGCGTDSEEVSILDYPKFFTPNNDGYNDFWQVKGIDKFPKVKIWIFDRYSKLLAELTSLDIGWDGSFNGKQLPSNDYWFIVDFKDGGSFKGHFSLIR